MRQLFTLITIICLVSVGCNDRQQSETARQPSTASQPAQQQPKLQEPIIPDDVAYSIIDSSTLAGIKRSLDVRLNKKVSERTLRAIALKLKSQDSRDYDRTFIIYYLPWMAVGSGAWATTHFNPDLEVRILGLTVQEEEKLMAEPAPANREIIGYWLDESPFVASRIMIFHEDGKLFIEQMFKDGSSLKKELVEKKAPLGRRFDKVEGSSAGDHWVLGSDGNLQLRDNDGLITTAKKIEWSGGTQRFASTAEAAEKYWIKVTHSVTGPFTVDAEIQTNIQTPVVFSLSLALSGLKPDDIFIGTDFISVPIVGGRGKATVDGTKVYPYGSNLPSGTYDVKVSFHPRWSENRAVASKLGIKDTIEAKSVVKLRASGTTVESVRKRAEGRKWVMLNVYSGMSWDPKLWKDKFGSWQEVGYRGGGNPRILKMYYFKAIDMTLMVNVLKQEIVTFRKGMEYK